MAHTGALAKISTSEHLSQEILNCTFDTVHYLDTKSFKKQIANSCSKLRNNMCLNVTEANITIFP